MNQSIDQRARLRDLRREDWAEAEESGPRLFKGVANACLIVALLALGVWLLS